MGKATQQTASKTNRGRTPPNVVKTSRFFTDLYTQLQEEAAQRTTPQPQSPGTVPGTRSPLQQVGQRGPTTATVGGGQRRWPVDQPPSTNANFGVPQTITGGYGNVFGSKPHDAQNRPLNTGMDITAQAGAPIFAVIGGTVVEAKTFNPQEEAAGRDSTGGYGNSIVIKGDDGLLYRYSHMRDAPGLQPGQRTTNQPIGAVGDTGNATGPHLDLEITDDQGNYVDGAALIRGEPQVTRLPPRGKPDPGPYQNQAGSAGGAGGAMPEWLAVAQSQMGKPYEWGSKGGRSDFGNPTGFDCSGFVSYVMKNGLGVNVPAFTGSAFPVTQEVPQEEAKAGDLVFWNMDTNDPRKQHIAIYLGGGKIVQSGGSGQGVNVTTVDQLPGATRNFRRVPQAQQALQQSGTPPDVSPYIGGEPRLQKQLMSSAATPMATKTAAGGRSMATPGLEWLQPGQTRRPPSKSIVPGVTAPPAGGTTRPMGPAGPPPGGPPGDTPGVNATTSPGAPANLQGPFPGEEPGGPARPGGTPMAWSPEQIRRVLPTHAQRIAKAASDYGVDAGIIAAVLLFESGGRPNQTSPQGAQGLMQVLPATAAGLGFDPKRLQDQDYNVEVGTAYLASLLQRKGKEGDYDDAVAAYINGKGLGDTTSADANGTTGPKYVQVVRSIESAIKSDEALALQLGTDVGPAPGSLTTAGAGQGGTGATPQAAGAPGATANNATVAQLQRNVQGRAAQLTAAQQALEKIQADHATQTAAITNDPANADPTRRAALLKVVDDKLAAAQKAQQDAANALEKARTDLAIEQTKTTTTKPGEDIHWQNGKPYRYVRGPDGKTVLEPIAIEGLGINEPIDPNRYVRGPHPNGLGEGLYDVTTGKWVYSPQESAADKLKREGEQIKLGYLEPGLKLEYEKAQQELADLQRKARVEGLTEADEVLRVQAESKIKQLEAGRWEEDFESDEASQAATTAQTQAATNKTNLEAAALQRKEDNWKKIEAAWQGGATMEDINRMVLQSAQDVDEYVKLQAEDRLRSTQAETQRKNLSDEELTRQQRRKEDVGQYATAMESYGRYGVASAPWQTGVLAAAAPIQGVGQAAKGMNIDPSQPWVQGIQKTYDDYSARQANTAGAAREALDKSRGNMFGIPTSKGPDTSGGASSGAGANYGTTNPPPTPATQAGPNTPGMTDLGTAHPVPIQGTGTGGTGGTGSDYSTPPVTAQPSGGRSPVQGQDALDLGDPAIAAQFGQPVQPGKALTIYENGEQEVWDINGGGGWLPQPTGVYGTGGGGDESGKPVYSQGRRLARKRRPVPGKQAVDLGDGQHAVTHYDDGSKEVWSIRGSGPSWEGVGGGGSGYWFDRPTTYGVGHTGGGGASVWQLPPGAETSMAQGLPPGQTPTAQQVQQPPQAPLAPQSGVAPIQVPPVTGLGDTTTARFPTPMSGGYGGPAASGGGQGGGADPALLDPAAMAAMGAGGAAAPPPPGGVGEPPPLSYNGGGLYTGGGAPGTASPYRPTNTPAPMWDAAVGAGGRNMTTGPGGQQGSATLYSRPGMAGQVGGGAGGGRGPTNYGGPVAPAAITPLQRLMQQSGLVPRMAGQASGSPGGI